MRTRTLVPALLLLPVIASAHDHYPFEFLKPTRTNAEFVERSFRSVLGRAPTASEQSQWVATLDRGSGRGYLFSTLLDSPSYQQQVTDEQAVVMEFSAVLQRLPTRKELAEFRAALGAGASRSAAFWALVMSRDFARRDLNPFYLMDKVDLPLHPSVVPQLRDLMRTAQRGQTEAFVETVAAPESPSMLAAAGPAPAADLVEVSGQAARSAFNDYRGYLHAHSYLSIDARDRGGSPDEAWTMARDQAHLDFMGITDHAEFLGSDRWQQLKDAATRYNQPGVFIALPGFEHSNPAMGHYCVMNTTDIRSALDKTTVSAFYDWLETQPQSVVTFNHPGSYDEFHIEFNHFAVRASILDRIVGVETMHGSFEDFQVGYDKQHTSYDNALLAGWRVGSVSAQDNHTPTYGIANDGRTVVFTDALTIDGLLEGYRARRMYAAEDKNLYMTFSTSDGHEMGSVLDRSGRTFEVGLDDPDQETFTKIDVVENGAVTHSQTIAATSGTWSFEVPSADHDRYFYVRATQQDGQRAESSPIWLVASSTSTVGVR
jgi:hypothetical protein